MRRRRGFNVMVEVTVAQDAVSMFGWGAHAQKNPRRDG